MQVPWLLVSIAVRVSVAGQNGVPMQVPWLLVSIAVRVSVAGQNGGQVFDWWLQQTDIVGSDCLESDSVAAGFTDCYNMKDCSINYIRSHKQFPKYFKPNTTYRLCLVPPNGTTVLPLKALGFKTAGNFTLNDCDEGRSTTNHNRFLILQQSSVKIDPVYGCMNAKLSGSDNIKKPISFSKSPLLLTFCTGAATDEGFLVAIDFSGDPRCTSPPPVNGSWSEWSCWSDCTHSCGGGTRSRNRTCDSTKLEHGSEDCVGNVTDHQQCNIHPCAVHGGLGSWSTWSDCTVLCGRGSSHRERTCDSPTPEHGGEDCDGDLKDVVQCNSQPCNEAAGETWNTTTIVTTVFCVTFGLCTLALVILLLLRCLSPEKFAQLFGLTPKSEVDRLQNKVNEQKTTIASSVSKREFFTARDNLKEELTAERRNHEIVKNENVELLADNLKMKHQLNQGYGEPEPPAGEANELADIDTASSSLNGEGRGEDDMTGSTVSSSSTSEINESAPLLPQQNYNELICAPAASDAALSTMQDAPQLLAQVSNSNHLATKGGDPRVGSTAL